MSLSENKPCFAQYFDFAQFEIPETELYWSILSSAPGILPRHCNFDK